MHPDRLFALLLISFHGSQCCHARVNDNDHRAKNTPLSSSLDSASSTRALKQKLHWQLVRKVQEFRQQARRDRHVLIPEPEEGQTSSSVVPPFRRLMEEESDLCTDGGTGVKFDDDYSLTLYDKASYQTNCTCSEWDNVDTVLNPIFENAQVQTQADLRQLVQRVNRAFGRLRMEEFYQCVNDCEICVNDLDMCGVFATEEGGHLTWTETTFTVQDFLNLDVALSSLTSDAEASTMSDYLSAFEKLNVMDFIPDPWYWFSESITYTQGPEAGSTLTIRMDIHSLEDLYLDDLMAPQKCTLTFIPPKTGVVGIGGDSIRDLADGNRAVNCTTCFVEYYDDDETGETCVVADCSNIRAAGGLIDNCHHRRSSTTTGGGTTAAAMQTTNETTPEPEQANALFAFIEMASHSKYFDNLTTGFCGDDLQVVSKSSSSSSSLARFWDSPLDSLEKALLFFGVITAAVIAM